MQTHSLSLIRRRAALVGLAATGALLLAGCSALPPSTAEAIVAQRAEQRWAALIDGDLEKAWEFTQPGYRAIVKQKDYRKRFGAAGQWKSVQIHGVQCEPERCTVKLRLTSLVMVPPRINREVIGYLDEIWVRDEGQWWYYQAL